MKKYIFFSLLFSLACLVWQCKDKPADEVPPTPTTPQGRNYTTVSTFTNANNPVNMAKDSQGNLYIVSFNGHIIIKITPSGTSTVFAGQVNTAGTTEGTGGNARFNYPTAICVDASDNLYITESNGAARIRKITPTGVTSTLAGSTSGQTGNVDGTGTSARFGYLFGITIDAQGDLYALDYNFGTIRKITQAGVVTTHATGFGTTRATGFFRNAQGIFYVATDDNHTIMTVGASGGVGSIYAGTGTGGFTDGTLTTATFAQPYGICGDNAGNIYVSQNRMIRKISNNNVTILAGTSAATGTQNGTLSTATFTGSNAIYLDPSNGIIYVLDPSGLIRKIE